MDDSDGLFIHIKTKNTLFLNVKVHIRGYHVHVHVRDHDHRDEQHHRTIG